MRSIENLKFGKAPAVYNKNTPQYSWFRRVSDLPARPKYFGDESLIGATDWNMYGNGPDPTVAPDFQGAGDCVFAGGAHETLLFNAEANNPVVFTGANVISDYSAVTGYVIGDPDSDQGTQTTMALDYRMNTGLIDKAGNRHKIGAYVALEPGNYDMLLEAAYIFTAVGIGIQVPDSAMDQFSNGQPWSVVHGAQIEGGHYIPIVANRDNLVIVTWGQTQQMTKQFYTKYCDEAYAILSTEMLKVGKSLLGFDLPSLRSYLQEVA